MVAMFASHSLPCVECHDERGGDFERELQHLYVIIVPNSSTTDSHRRPRPSSGKAGTSGRNRASIDSSGPLFPQILRREESPGHDKAKSYSEIEFYV
jgi:hypothetical protein